METKLATVDLLPGRDWNAKACFGDALQRADIDAPAVAIWLDSEGQLRHSLSCTEEQTLWLLHKAMRELI